MMPTRLSASLVIGAPVGIAAGVVVIPPAGVERMPLEGLSMPDMPGSLGTCNGPVPMPMNCAVKASPRLVWMTQREFASSHFRSTTSV